MSQRDITFFYGRQFVPVSEPGRRDFRRVKADQFSSSWDFQVRDVAPNPAVNRTGELDGPQNFVRSNLTRQWQFFWADLLSMKMYGKLFSATAGAEEDFIIRKFSALSHSDKFLTNFAGTDIRNNYLTDEMRGNDPKVDPLICAGSIVEVMEERNNRFSVRMCRLRSFLANDTPPIVTPDLLENDARVLRATVIGVAGNLYPFPHLEGLDVPYPYISSHDCWFPAEDLVKL